MLYLLPQLCDVYRNVIVKDEYNTPSETFQKLYSKVKCRISRSNRGKREQKNPQDTVQVEYVLYVMNKADVVAGDIVELDGVKYTAAECYAVYGSVRLHHKEIPLTTLKEL